MAWFAPGWKLKSVELVPYEGMWLPFEHWRNDRKGEAISRPSDLSERWLDMSFAKFYEKMDKDDDG